MQGPVLWEQKILRGIDMSFIGTRPTQRSLTSLVLLVTITVLSFLFWSGLTQQSLPIWHFRCPVWVQQGDAVVGDALSVGDCIFKLCVYSRWLLVSFPFAAWTPSLDSVRQGSSIPVVARKRRSCCEELHEIWQLEHDMTQISLHIYITYRQYDKLNWAHYIWGAKEFHLAHVSWTWLDYTSSLPMLAAPPSWCTRANGDAQTGDGSATWRSCCAWTCTFDHQMTSAALRVDLPWIFRLLGPARAIHHHVMIEVGEEKIRKSVNERGEMDKTETHIHNN